MKKKLALLLAVVMCVQAMAGLTLQAASFTDISETYDNARIAIEKWAGYGIVTGTNVETGEFSPMLNFQRYQMAVMMDKIMGYTETATNQFTDLPADELIGQ